MSQGSFVQLNKTKVNLHKLAKKVFKQHNEISPMIMALISLMEGEQLSEQ